MEKFALLNLLKAIDGLKNAQSEQNTPPDAAPFSAPPADKTEAARPQNGQSGEMPNLMYEALMRHEQMSNRIRNRK